MRGSLDLLAEIGGEQEDPAHGAGHDRCAWR